MPETKDEDEEEKKLSWWEEKMLIESEEQTRLLKKINRDVLVIGIVILLATAFLACNLSGLLGTFSRF
jgi:hypothetical protein